MKRILSILYAVALHLLLAILLFRPGIVDEQRWRLGLTPPEPSAFATQTHQMYRAIDRQAKSGASLLIGDSHFQRMPADLLPKAALNFGIGGDTLRHMVKRVNEYQSLGDASAIFIWAGYNDLIRRGPEEVARDMEKLMIALPDDKTVYLLGLPPVKEKDAQKVSNAAIETLNDRLAKRCLKPCRYVEIGSILSDANGALATDYDSGDGIHLNRTGYTAIAAKLGWTAE